MAIKKKKKPEKTTQKMKEEIASEIISKFPKEEEKTTPPKGPGRPPKISIAILQKLRICFSVGMTDEETCYHCKIGLSTLYDYQEAHPEFSEEKKILKQNITMQAKFNVGKAIKNGSVYDSWERLKRRDPEFKTNNTADINIKDGDRKISVKVKLPE